MEIEASALFLLLDGKLAEETLFVDTDAHRREFEGALEGGVPDEDVAVEPRQSVLAKC